MNVGLDTFEPQLIGKHPTRWTGFDDKTAAPSIAHIHDRMPVVLKPDHFAAWLDPKTQGQEVQDALSDALTGFLSYPVSTKVNNARNDFPELLEPLAPI